MGNVLSVGYSLGRDVHYRISNRVESKMIRNLFLILPIRNEKNLINAMHLPHLSWRFNSINTVTHLHYKSDSAVVHMHV